MVHGRQLIAIAARGALVLRLRGRCSNVPVAICCHFSRRRTCVDPATPAVIAHAARLAIVDHRFVVHVVNVRHVDVVDRAVVKKAPAMPVSAFVAEPAVTEAIVNSAIEADMRSPVSGVPEISTSAPAPIAWSPQEADLWSNHPRAGHPVVAVNPVGPVAGRPNVAVTGANRLRINRQWRWRNRYRDAKAEARCRSCCGNREDCKNHLEQSDYAHFSHDHHPFL